MNWFSGNSFARTLLFMVSSIIWTTTFVGCLVEEQCEEVKMDSQYCPLRPTSSFRMNKKWTLSYEVCDSEILPICVTAPRRKLTVTTIKPKIKVPTTTKTTTTTTPKPVTQSKVDQDCEEVTSQCDNSTTWLTFKTTIDMAKLISQARKQKPAENDEGPKCEEVTSECDTSTTWLTFKTTIDMARLKSQARKQKPPENDEGQKCEEVTSECDTSKTWLTFKTTIDMAKLKSEARKRKPVTRPPLVSEKPPMEEATESQECEEARSRCDMSTRWLKYKTTIDLAWLKSKARKPKPIVTKPPVLSETSSQLPPTKATTELQKLEPKPNLAPPSNFKELQDVFRNFPVSRGHFAVPGVRQNVFVNPDSTTRARTGTDDGRHQALTADHPLDVNLWKVRKTLADVWKAEERFEVLAAAAQQKRRRIEQKEAAARRFASGMRRRQPGVNLEWDYFHPAM